MCIRDRPGKNQTSEIGLKCNILLVLFPKVVQKQTMGAAENLIILLQVTIKNVRDFFFQTRCTGCIMRIIHLTISVSLVLAPKLQTNKRRKKQTISAQTFPTTRVTNVKTWKEQRSKLTCTTYYVTWATLVRVSPMVVSRSQYVELTARFCTQP